MGDGLCVIQGIRRSAAKLAAPLDTTDQKDVDFLVRRFGLNDETAKIKLRDLLLGHGSVQADGIRADLIAPLERRVKALGYRTVYREFTDLFGDGDWGACFPDLAEGAKKAEADVLRRIGEPYTFHHPDFNEEVFQRIHDFGIDYYVYERDGCYVRGRADVRKMDGVTGRILIFDRIDKTQCRDGRELSEGFLEHSGTNFIAIFGPRVGRDLSRAGLPPTLYDQVIDFLAYHAVSHRSDDKRQSRLMIWANDLSKKKGQSFFTPDQGQLLHKGFLLQKAGQEFDADKAAMKNGPLTLAVYKALRSENAQDSTSLFLAHLVGTNPDDAAAYRAQITAWSSFFDRYKKDYTSLLDRLLPRDVQSGAEKRAVAGYQKKLADRLHVKVESLQDPPKEIRDALVDEALAKIIWSDGQKKKEFLAFIKRWRDKYETLLRSQFGSTAADQILRAD